VQLLPLFCKHGSHASEVALCMLLTCCLFTACSHPVQVPEYCIRRLCAALEPLLLPLLLQLAALPPLKQ
jgi:hypothetical protein